MSKSRNYMVESSKPLALFYSFKEAVQYYKACVKEEKSEVSLLRMRFKKVDNILYPEHEIILRSVKQQI